jgi:hypothetical protein
VDEKRKRTRTMPITKTKLLTAAIIILIFPTVTSTDPKVRLTEISALTFRQGDLTTARRGAPIAQLTCSGSCRRAPTNVQCINVGHDGKDVNWKCDGEIPSETSFGDIDVNCEGYSYPEDPFVLVGSCGLFYQLTGDDTIQMAIPVSEKSSGFPYGGLILLALLTLACSGSSFWQGAAAGAIVGSALTSGHRRRRSQRRSGRRGTGWSSSSTRQATGFGRTTRR